MPDVHDSSDRSARPRLPRQAKLPKTPPRPPHHRVTRATAPASTSVAPSYLSSPVSPGQLTESDDNAPLQHATASARKRRAVSGHDALITTKRSRQTPRKSTANVSYAESDSDTDLKEIGDANYYDNLHQDSDDGNVHGSSPVKPSRRGRPSSARKQLKTTGTSTSIKGKEIEGSPVRKTLRYSGNLLPYHVWCRVFDHIASPLLDPEARLEDVVQTMRELLKDGSLGKLVYEPAMVALYRCPPILDQRAFRLLSRTLSQPPDNTLINYRPKVETLRIDVYLILQMKYGGSYLLLDEIVPYLPRLMDLELSHHYDKAPYRELDTLVKYKYPHNLLQVLGPVPDAIEEQGDKTTSTELRSWRWNSRLAGDVFPLNELKEYHSSLSFATLRKIAFVNYQLPSTLKKSPSPETLEERNRKATADLAAAIGALPHLEHLIFESSTVVDSKLLDVLPTTLKSLDLINCWEVTSGDFANFLCSHGNSLERLTLNHCFALSMGFTSILEHACPKLTHLHMNLLYYKTYEYTDAEPYYDFLLRHDEVPKWPPSIQSIEIDYMRFTSVKTANMFFNSLVASAPKLPNLRRLVLGAKINVSFRERNDFRNAWEKTFDEVFKRHDNPPISIHNRASRMSDNRPRDLNSDLRTRGLKPLRAPVRRGTRRVDNPPSPSSGSDVVAREDSARAKSLAKQLQWSMRDMPASRYRGVVDEESEDELAGDPDGQHNQLNAGFIHGLCDVVEIKVDNQKPTEHQMSMEDFLDMPDDESDAEWNSDESEPEDPVIE